MWAEERGPVAVEQIVAARDRRKTARRRMIADHGLPVVCLTLVSPGPVKWWSWTERVFGVAEAELRRAFGDRGWMVREWEDQRPTTGPEAQIAVNASPWEIKRVLLKLEDTHLLGRLWDMDVITTDGLVLDRAKIGIRPRRCLVCTTDADTCTRTDAHPDDALLKAVDQILARAEATTGVLR
ncbi:citrate lyase holo-[acyl-carrier protein] synthase [Propionicicella superfundia]|uniref:citrate lyase holo-[acyl-carrier protein] synthase n=1 Tax=Propionicicella superfundia TaxID=348582 RepID=UPI001FE0914B|nr:citrate lyase holo-[acyl-carrier protein] synthase [Propionicicella superfundia]